MLEDRKVEERNQNIFIQQRDISNSYNNDDSMDESYDLFRVLLLATIIKVNRGLIAMRIFYVFLSESFYFQRMCCLLLTQKLITFFLFSFFQNVYSSYVKQKKFSCKFHELLRLKS